MKKIFSWILAVVLVCSTMWIGSEKNVIRAEAEQSAIVKNGGFEDTGAVTQSATDGQTMNIGSSGWRIGVSSSNDVNNATMYAEVVKSGGRSGASALKVYAKEIGEKEEGQLAKGKASLTKIGITGFSANTPYLFRAYVKAEETMTGNETVYVVLKHRVNSGDSLSTVATIDLVSPGKAEWYELKKEFTLSAVGTGGLNIEIQMDKFTVNGAAFLLDDVSIIALPFIELSQSEASVFVGDSVDLTKVLYDSKTPILGTTPEITWESSDESVATVDVNGKVTGLSAGTTTITVTATNTADPTKTTGAACVVTVNNVMPTEITLDKASAALTVGDETTLTATVLPENTTNKAVTWESDNESVATVDVNGKVIAVGVGDATITTASVADPTKTATCTVSVASNIVKPESITLNKSSVELNVRDEVTLMATVLPENTTDKAVTWVSGNESVATVDASGKVTAVGAGTATITTTSNADGTVKATCTVTVTEVAPTDISLSESSVALKTGDVKNLTATLSPANTTNQTVNWLSSDESVAMVDESGKVTAVGAGTAIITAASDEDSQIKASCTVTVTASTIMMNGGFEETGTGTTDGAPGSSPWIVGANSQWKFNVSSSLDVNDAVMKAEIMAAGGRTESQAVKVYATEVTAGKKGKGVVLQNRNYSAELKANGRYLVTVYAKAEAGLNDDSTINIIVYNNKVNIGATDAVEASTAKNGWIAITKEVVLAEAPNTDSLGLAVEVHMDNIKETDAGWILDDISVVHVPTVEIAPGSVNLEMGDTAEVTPVISDPHKVLGETPVLNWSSDDESVVTVKNENGVVTLTAVGTGETVIKVTGTYADGAKIVSAEIPVKVIPKQIIVNGDFASGLDRWMAGQGVTVDESGRTGSGVKLSEDGNISQSLDVRVSEGLLVSGVDYLVTVYAKPVGANSDSKVTVRWKDSADAAAKTKEITAGTLTDWTPITFRITAGDMSEAGTALEVKVSGLTEGYWLIDDTSVKRAPYVSLNFAQMNLAVGGRKEIDAVMVDPDYVLEKTGAFDYTSADASIAKVDMKGRVTGVSAGTTTITVTSAYDPEYSAVCTVTVSETGLTKIELPESMNLCTAEQKKLTVVTTPADATSQKITWTSSDNTVAVVDGNGLVTGIKTGTATITAAVGNLTATCEVTVRTSTTLLTEDAEIKSTTYREVTGKFEHYVTNNTGADAVYTLYEAPENGVLTVNEDGSYSYIPRNGQEGDEESFIVIVTAGTESAFLKGTIVLKDSADETTGADETTEANQTIEAEETTEAEESVEQKYVIDGLKDSDISGELKQKGLDTVAKIEDVLYLAITTDGQFSKENTLIRDVKLMISEDNGNTWIKADREHFPADGKITVLLPYPEGTNGQTHDFRVVHMFTSDANGKVPGTVEMPAVTETEDGLQVVLTGLSPVSVSWTKTSETTLEETTEADEITEANQTTEAEETTETGGTTGPDTGDVGRFLLWTVLAVVALMVMAGVSRKRKLAGILILALCISSVGAAVPARAETTENSGEGTGTVTEAEIPDISGKEHPYVLVNEEYLDNLLTLKDNEYYASSFAWVEGQAEKELPAQPAGGYLSASISRQLEARAFMYALGMLREIDAVETVEYTIEYLKNAKSTQTNNIQLYKDFGDNGIQMGSLVYDWCHDIMTERQRKELATLIREMVYDDEIQKRRPDNMEDWTDLAGSAVGQPLVYNTIAALAIYDEYPEIYDTIMPTILGTMAEAMKLYGEAGALTDGSISYTREYYAYYVAVMLDRLGYDYSEYYGNQSKIGYKMLYSRTPYGALIRQGDDWAQTNYVIGTYTNASETKYTMAMLSAMYDDPYLKFQYIKENTADNSLFSLLFNSSEVEPELPDDLPLAFEVEEYRSEIMARTSWQEGLNAPTVLAYMNMNNRRTGDHDHSQIGSFQLYYKGPLTMTGGSYTGAGWGGDHWENYYTRSIAANCVTVYDSEEMFTYGQDSWKIVEANDGGQKMSGYKFTLEENMAAENLYAETLASFIGPNEYTPAFSYIKGDLTNAYSASKMENYKRAMVFMDTFNEDYPGVMIVFDRVVSKDASLEKNWLLQAVTEPIVEGNKITIINTADGCNGKLVNTTLYPQQVEITAVGGIGQYVSDGQEWANNFTASDAYKSGFRCEVSPKTAAAEDIFLNAMYVTAADGNAVELPMIAEETDKFMGVTTLDRMVMFSKSGEKVNSAFTVTVRENGYDEMICLMTDVATGKWTVSGNGTSVTVEASAEDGCLVFTAAPGAYTVTPAEAEDEVTEFVWEQVEKEAVGDFAIKTKSGYTYVKNPNRLVEGTPYIAIADFMEMYCGATTSADGKTLTIVMKNGREVTLTAGSKTYTVNTNGALAQGSLEFEPFLDASGVFYLNMEGIAPRLGLNAAYKEMSKVMTVSFSSAVQEPTGDITMGGVVDPNKALLPESVIASSDDGNVPENLLDRSLNTHWSAIGDGEWVCFDLGEETEISSVQIAFYNALKRYWRFDIQVSADGENFTTVLEGMESSRETLDPQMYVLPDGTTARYVRLVGHGVLNENHDFLSWRITLKEFIINK